MRAKGAEDGDGCSHSASRVAAAIGGEWPTMDWTNVAVAAITVAGTLGGGIVTQVFAIRSKRIDAKTQRENRGAA
ncbi:hypothetical protein BOX37_14625 [Nocardia mangyaensis]|uniref:Uncharacterized protein n=1 Tax=Nocardia mangyaensis TaxID=2213200 RepID=A0A1J0VSI4_9NOCA|nr:hypothetical protein BOX37_14625 [Nocardia mangyaensis]